MLNNICFQTVVLRKLLRVPWIARKSSQSILKEINPEYSLEGLMLKLKLQYWPMTWRDQLIGKEAHAGKDWRQEEKGMTENKMAGWHHWLSGHEFEQSLGDGEGQGSQAIHEVTKKWIWLSDWTTRIRIILKRICIIVLKSKSLESGKAGFVSSFVL